MNTKQKVATLTGIAGILAISFGLWNGRHHAFKRREKPRAPVTSSTAYSSFDLSALAKRARSAVVSIETFDNEGNSIGTGSGFFVSDDGLLVTNYHVIEKADRAVAKTEAGDELSIEGAAYFDQKNDLAVLGAVMFPGKVPFLRLGNSGQVDVGGRVAVIGNPLGLEGSLSEGIVSAKRDWRSMLAPQASPDAVTSAGGHKWLQITAAISPGSSGSPVLDASGNVIGVATMKLFGGESLNFAVPAEVALAMMQTEAKKDSTQRRLIPLKELADADATAKSSIEHEAREAGWPVMFALEQAKSAAKFHRIVDWDKVLNLAKALVNKYPQVGPPYACLGDVYRAMGLSDEAIEAYKQAVKLEPEDGFSWESLGSVLKEKGQDTSANYAFSEAIAAETKTVGFGKSLLPGMIDMKPTVFNRIGDIYHSAGNNKAAEEAYLKAIEASPGNVIALHSLGRIYAEQGNEQKALGMFYRWASLLAAKTAKDDPHFRPPEAVAWAELSEFYGDAHNEEAELRCFAKARSLGLKSP